MNKIDDLHILLYDENPDILGISESWTHEGILDAELTYDGYTLFRCDRPMDNRGGGVLLYVRSEFQPCEYHPQSKFPEQVWCQLTMSVTESLLIGVCYRSTSDSLYVHDTGKELRDLMDELGGRHFMLMGDFNYPDIDWNHQQCSSSASEGTRLFLESIEGNYIKQHVQCATRQDAVLDLILTDEDDMIDHVDSLGPFASSDHNLLKWQVTRSQHIRSGAGRNLNLDYRRGDYDGIRLQLRAVNWADLFEGTSTEEAWQAFTHKLLDCEKKFIPNKSNHKGRSKPIWMTHKALKSLRHKYKTFDRYKDADHPAYVRAAKAAKKELRKARHKFEYKLAQKVKSDKKSFFAYTRSKTRCRTAPGPLLNQSGELIKGPQEMSEEFNSFFASVFTKEDLSNIPLSKRDDSAPILDIIRIDEERVRKCMTKLRADKSPGSDDISPRLLIEITDEIVTPLTLIFNKSLQTGSVPEDWRTANVSPIYKKGKRNSPENYRPISLTSQICKLFEHIVREDIVHHLESHQLISDTQHGFRKGRSCLTNLLVFLDEVSSNMDNGNCIDAIYLDFAKAFDRVPHQRLIQKLQYHGISGALLKWISSWLHGRRQRVQISGVKSDWITILSGVPQGSVLGPVLFLIYINDLGNEVNASTTILKFADDTKIFGICNTIDEHKVLQDDMVRLQIWANEWQMTFNVDKCKTMHLGYGNKDMEYLLDNKVLASVNCEKDLGVWITDDLKPVYHITEACKKANRMLGLLKRTIVHKDPYILVTLYKSLVRPHLEYCCSAWSPYYLKDKECLERVQHRFTRLFKEFKDLDYYARLRQLRLWSLEERRNRADLIEVFKLCKGLTSIPLERFFDLDTGGRTRGHSLKLRKPSCHTNVRKYFFSIRVINRWNSLGQEAVESTSINSFKKHLQ